MKKAKFRDIKPTPIDSKIDESGVYIKAAIETVYEETLIISAYAIVKKKKNEGYRCIFQQFITENDFVAINYLDSTEGAWSESTLLRFFESRRWHFYLGEKYNPDYIKCATEKDNDIINRYYQTKFQVGINLINNHQVKLRESALYYKHDIERRELDRIHIQEIYLPADLHDWISDEIAKDNAKYFYETDKKTKIKRGVCSYCKAESTLKLAKHNSFGECPNCKTGVQFKAINKAKYYEDYDYFAFAQRIDSGIMIRRFKVKLEYKRPEKTDIKNTLISIAELSRSVLEESKARSTHYEYGEFKKREYRWKREESSSFYYGGGSVAYSTRNTFMRLYPFNLKDVIAGTKWEYCGIELFKGKIDPMDYFEFDESKLLEMIVRRGLHKLAQDMLNTNYSSKATHFKIMQTKSMGLSEYALFMAKKYNLGLNELDVLSQLENQYQIKLNIDQINWIVKVHQDFGRILNILKYSSVQKMINYVNKQSAEGDAEIKATIREWDDYIQMAAKFKYNLSDEILLYPKDLARRHDEVMIRAKAMENKRFNLGIKKTAKNFMWLNFSKFGLMMTVAKNTKEIIKESQILGHCVGRGTGYMERMSEGKTLILTIRKADSPNIPYFTVEVNPETFSVRQYESSKRIRKSEEIEKFLKEWEKHVAKKSISHKKTNKVRSNEYEHRIAN